MSDEELQKIVNYYEAHASKFIKESDKKIDRKLPRHIAAPTKKNSDHLQNDKMLTSFDGNKQNLS